MLRSLSLPGVANTLARSAPCVWAACRRAGGLHTQAPAVWHGGRAEQRRDACCQAQRGGSGWQPVHMGLIQLRAGQVRHCPHDGLAAGAEALGREGRPAVRIVTAAHVHSGSQGQVAQVVGVGVQHVRQGVAASGQQRQGLVHGGGQQVQRGGHVVRGTERLEVQQVRFREGRTPVVPRAVQRQSRTVVRGDQRAKFGARAAPPVGGGLGPRKLPDEIIHEDQPSGCGGQRGDGLRPALTL